MSPSPAELEERLASALGNPPFPWQARLLARLVYGMPPAALDIPTGLGKTSVMATWLVAQTFGAGHLPRRLIYIVDRRAVVDQATTEAVRLRSWLRDAGLEDDLGLGGRHLPISTLRGQFVDNHEWLEDPTVPAIVVGTVDMIGSRLLFEGYACSRKMRPYHAGMLGSDTLFVLDEAHLVAPFERLLEQVVGRRDLRASADEAIVPRPRLLALSATGRDREDAFRLDSRDHEHPEVQRRIWATKGIAFEHLAKTGKLAEALAQRAWDLARDRERPVRVIVFSQKRSDAEAAKTHLESKLARDPDGKKVAVSTELFVGGRRNRERVAAAQTLSKMGFLAGSAPPEASTFLFATSAGEVGVDLDADHMVCDVVPWERMVQRLGRVNRRGTGAADVVFVAHDTEDRAACNTSVEALVRRLPVAPGGGEPAVQRWSGSPSALTSLRDAARDEVREASTPAPLYPALTRPLVDAWSMTSMDAHTGRPEVQPWLRGWDSDEPQTTVVWRRLLPPANTRARRVRQFFEAAPPHASERLEAPTSRVGGWLLSRLKALVATEAALEKGDRVQAHDPIAFALNAAGERSQSWTRDDLERISDDRARKRLGRELAGATLVVDARLGGLSPDGLLDDKSKSADVRTIDADGPVDAWMASVGEAERPVVPFRVLRQSAAQEQVSVAGDDAWFQRFRHPIATGPDEAVTEWLVVEKWRHASTTEDDRAAGRPQELGAHQEWAAEEARRIAESVGLPNQLCDVLYLAAALHDEGKRAARWQRAFSAPDGGRPYAKTRGPVNVRLLDGYRHEFGSLPLAQADPRFQALDPDQQDLVLHLVAAHHGFARPTIRTTGCEDAPPSGLVARARDVALRFFRLQEKWGPWGLAWLETLLRAADQIASRRNDEGGARR